MNIAYTINYCSKLLKNKLNQALEQEDLTVAQFAAIKDIEIYTVKKGTGQGVTAAQIADRLDMDKPTVSGVINRLVDKNYVEKLPNPADGRSFLLKLTPESKERLPNLEKIQDLVLAEITQGLTGQEIDQFQGIIQKIIENME